MFLSHLAILVVNREVHALSIQLEVSGNDWLFGGNNIVGSEDGEDILIGQRGSDSVFGDNGNDIVIGDMAYMTSATLWNNIILPTSLVATRLFNSPQLTAANNTLSLSLSPLGSLIVSPMVMLPREMELPISPVETVGGWTHPNLRTFENFIDSKLLVTYQYPGQPASFDNGDVMYFKPLISFGGSVVKHSTSVDGDIVQGSTLISH
jgi:Ca2+-binding RTX toxin-like protein